MEWLSFDYGCRHNRIPSVDQDQDPENYAINWNVDAMGYVVGGDDEEQEHIGRARFSVIYSAYEIDLFDTLDAIDQELSSLAEMLTSERPDLLAFSGVDVGGDIVFVHTVEVLPVYRRQKVGHAIVKAFMKTVARNAPLVVLRAAPFLTEEGPKEGSPEHEAAKARLRRYWVSCGFEVASGDYLYMVVDDA